MANAVKTTIKVDYSESGVLIRSLPLRVFDVVTTSNLLSDNTQLVGTTHEQVVVGDVTDDAMMIVQNLHATALVQIGIDDAAVFVPVVDIPAGGPPAVLPVASSLAATYLQSSAATTPVRVTLVKIVAPA
jgi:hypothetical protein